MRGVKAEDAPVLEAVVRDGLLFQEHGRALALVPGLSRTPEAVLPAVV